MTVSAHAKQETLIKVDNLQVSFRLDRDHVFDAVKGISFDIPANSTVALVGESGSGKTVSAMAIIGLLPKESSIVSKHSAIIYDRKNLLACDAALLREIRGKAISMIFQEPMSSLNPVICVGDQIAESLIVHLRLSRKQAWARARDLLREVGITEPERRIKSYPHELSGGQQQRVMIAMAIACEPKLLIADEPTTALDVTIQRQILDLIAKLQQRRRMSVLFITHDLDVVGEIADHVIVMREGEIKEAGSAESIFTSPQHAYTKALLACRPRVDSRPHRLAVIEDFANSESPAVLRSAPRRGANDGDPIILEAKGVSKDFMVRDGLFSRKPFRAVNDVSFRLPKGRTVGLVGESGSGKSTLGLTLMRLHAATAGEVWFDGKNLLALSGDEFQSYRRRIQIIFQNPYASLNPRFSVGNILIEPMQIHGIGANEEERTGLAVELMKKVGLPLASLRKYPHEFSGGQRQRIAIARCLTMKPDVLICDESVSALDVSIQAQVLNLLQDLQDEFGMSYLFISHDLAVVKYISDTILVMQNGEVVERAAADEIYHRPQHPYTKQLLAAAPAGWNSKTH
ncbi:MAG: dipeptide ABC transporter ATP-binding protein [Burkholderiales bacterium]